MQRHVTLRSVVTVEFVYCLREKTSITQVGEHSLQFIKVFSHCSKDAMVTFPSCSKETPLHLYLQPENRIQARRYSEAHNRIQSWETTLIAQMRLLGVRRRRDSFGHVSNQAETHVTNAGSRTPSACFPLLIADALAQMCFYCIS